MVDLASSYVCSKSFSPSVADTLFVAKSRKTVRAILRRQDPRWLLLVGPCSIHDPLAAYEYGQRLRVLAQEVESKFFIVMRAYVEKPRTTVGWKGFLYDPDLNGSYDIERGVQETRRLFAQLTNLRLPLGSEILELNTVQFYRDYLSWGCIGARTCASSPHRQVASGLPFAVGFKNGLDGCTETAIQGLVAAAQSHVFLGIQPHGSLGRIVTQGNPSCHMVLRGGMHGPNYFPANLHACVAQARQYGVAAHVVIDCSHDNSHKQYAQQANVFREVCEQSRMIDTPIVGMMLESFLEAGNQPIEGPLQWGISVTDGCMDWSKQEDLIHTAYDNVTLHRGT